MLKRTFCHLPKIGKKVELKLWSDGIKDQIHFFDNLNQFYKGKRLSEMKRALGQSIKELQKNNLYFFYELLPRDELYRLAIGRMEEITFVDIETTGLAPPPRCKTTTISLVKNGVLYQASDRGSIKKLIRDVLEKSPLICSYYGEVFDIPFLRQDFNSKLKIAHIDLCFWLRRLGHTGGLKGVQKQFKKIPTRKSMDLDGFDAVTMWKMYEDGNQKALETLLTYNAEDTVVLCHLLHLALQKESISRKQLNLELQVPRIPEIKTSVNLEVYKKIKSDRENHE